MPTLHRLTLREIQLPLREPFVISSGVVHHRRILLLEAEDSAGVVAWSECVAGEQPNYSPETVDTAWLAITHWLAPRLLGREWQTPREVHGWLERDVRGHNMAKAALEMLCWGLIAELRGEPLARVLGGTREQVVTGISVGIQPTPAALAAKAEESVALGYRKVKLKIKPGADVDYVAAVRAAVGPEVELSVDANCAYTLADADHLARLDPYRLLMLEQPLAWDDLVDHAALQPRLATPLCLDESITSVDRTRQMIQLGSGRIVNIKPGRVGGFTTSVAIHDLCRQHDVPVWCGGMLESGIGRAYNVALASLPNFQLPGDLSPSARYWQRDIVDPEWTMDEGGRVRVPLDRPGLGIEVDRRRVDQLTARSETLTPS